MAIEYDPKADCYATLGIDNTATAEVIKKAHRERIRDLHPDRGGDSARATAVNLARDVLGEASTRRAYDQARSAWHMERRAWLVALLNDPGLRAVLDGDGRSAAHVAAQQRTKEAEVAAQQRPQEAKAPPAAGARRAKATAPTAPSEAERAARHARKWQWGVMADLAWPDVSKAFAAGDWLPAIAWLGTALLADRAIEIHCPTEQLAALDALIEARQRERKAKLVETIAQALGRHLGRGLEEVAAQMGGVARRGSTSTGRASASSQPGQRRNPVTRGGAVRGRSRSAR